MQKIKKKVFCVRNPKSQELQPLEIWMTRMTRFKKGHPDSKKKDNDVSTRKW